MLDFYPDWTLLPNSINIYNMQTILKTVRRFKAVILVLCMTTTMATAQVSIDTQAQQDSSQVAEAQDLTMAELLFKGGIIMLPIGFLFICATYVAIERYLYIRTASKRRADFLIHIKKQLISGDIKSAKIYADQESSAYGRIIRNALAYVGSPFKEIESIMESAANIEVAKMERHLGYLGIIAGIAPMLGFIGTIVGIIHIFYNISLADNISIGIIAGGLYEKMITSGTGLVVGMIAYAMYHLLNQMITRFILNTQQDTFDFIRAITSSNE